MEVRELESDSSVGGCHVVEQLVAVLANEGLLVVAGHIVPGDAVAVHIVKYSEAGLGRSVDVELCVVGLADLLVPGLAPGIEAKTVGNLVRRSHLLAGGRPEPAVDVLGLQIATILTSLEVTEATACPDVRDIACKVTRMAK